MYIEQVTKATACHVNFTYHGSERVFEFIFVVRRVITYRKFQNVRGRVCDMVQQTIVNVSSSLSHRRK